MPSSSSLCVTGQAITIEAWVFPTNFWPGGRSDIVRKREHGGAQGGYLFGITEQRRLSFGGVFDSGEWQDAADAGDVPLYTWSHVAVTYDGRLVRYYLNGVLVDTRVKAGSLLADTQSLMIGRITDWFDGEFFYGLIDEVRISKTVRIYSAGVPTVFTSLPQNQTLSPSDTGILCASAYGNPLPSYQ